MHVSHEYGRLVDIAGNGTQSSDLVVGVGQRVRRTLQKGGNPGGFQAGHHVARIVGEDYQVRGETEDGLDVGLVAAQVGGRCFSGVVGHGVHGHDTVAGVDGEQHLGGHGRDGHDAFRTGAFGGGRGPGRSVGGLGAATGGDDDDQERAKDLTGHHGGSSCHRGVVARSTGPLSVGRTDPLASRVSGSHGGSWFGLAAAERRRHHRCGTVPGSHRTSVLRPHRDYTEGEGLRTEEALDRRHNLLNRLVGGVAPFLNGLAYAVPDVLV